MIYNRKIKQFMPANQSNTYGVINILIHSAKYIFKTFH